MVILREISFTFVAVVAILSAQLACAPEPKSCKECVIDTSLPPVVSATVYHNTSPLESLSINDINWVNPSDPGLVAVKVTTYPVGFPLPVSPEQSWSLFFDYGTSYSHHSAGANLPNGDFVNIWCYRLFAYYGGKYYSPPTDPVVLNRPTELLSGPLPECQYEPFN